MTATDESGTTVRGVVTRLSPWTVDETVARLSAVLAARGIKLFAVIDQAAEAAAVDLRLRPTRLAIFGNPKAGTPVMDAAPLSALDLPLKVVIWEDSCETKVSYLEPAELAKRYQLGAEMAGQIAAVPAIVDAVIDR